jgi:hypothetical protein
MGEQYSTFSSYISRWFTDKQTKMLATDSLLYVDQIGTLVPCSCVEEYLSLIDTDSVILQNMNLIEDVYIYMVSSRIQWFWNFK